MAALGELLFYISTQNEHARDSKPMEFPSKDIRPSSCWQGKKFAKPEFKSCIEEFDEKLNNFDIERKEQELTAKNAQSHQQEVESFESITMTEKEEEEIDDSEIIEGQNSSFRDHANALKFYFWYETSAHLWLVLEYCVGGNLMSLLQQGKKFAKSELKSCIEEFDEKLNNSDIERKEQELTAKYAQSHQREGERFESITVTEKEDEEIDDSEIIEDILWHPSDLSARPTMPNRKSNKGSDAVPSLSFDAPQLSDFVKLSKEQLDCFNSRISSIVSGNTP